MIHGNAVINVLNLEEQNSDWMHVSAASVYLLVTWEKHERILIQ